MSYAPGSFNGSSSGVSSTYTNNTGSTVAIGTPLSTSGSGDFVLTDVSNEATVLNIIGYAGASIANGATGPVIGNGRVLNITTSYTSGTPVWFGSTPGTFTDVKPDLTQPGWAAGMFVVFAGVIVTNQTNALLLDLQILTEIIGQLE